MKNLEIHIDSWIMQDGNYPDFCINEHHRFAIELWSIKDEKSDKIEKDFNRIDYGIYTLSGEIIWQNKEATIIDFGLYGYINIDLTKKYKTGQYLKGQFGFGIDHYYYFECLSGIKGIPGIIYDWRIKKIGLNTAPFIETKQMGRTVLTRDESKTEFKTVDCMNSWEDDNGYGHYLLDIELINNNPKWKI